MRGARVDWSDADSVIEHQVGYARVLAGEERPFDERACRDLVRRDVERARDFAAAAEPRDARRRTAGRTRPCRRSAHPTLVIHGTADPMFPIQHGEALAAEIPGARLLRLGGAGHGMQRADWEPIADAILEHTA